MPASVHMLRGNPSKLSLADLSGELRPPTEIPDCPKHLQPEARKEWRRITLELVPLKLVSRIDRAALSVYCATWARVVLLERALAARMAKRAREAGDKDDALAQASALVDITPQGYRMQCVEVQMLNRERDALDKWLAHFGMSPATRARVTPGTPQIPLPGLEGSSSAPEGWAIFRRGG